MFAPSDGLLVLYRAIVFGRLLRVDCPKHLLEHCLMGLFGWENQVLLKSLEW